MDASRFYFSSLELNLTLTYIRGILSCRLLIAYCSISPLLLRIDLKRNIAMLRVIVLQM